VVPLYHPAALFYNRDLKEVMEEDFRVLERFV
jgi:uracil-DNA glycosylase